MKYSSFKYLFKEGLKNLWYNRVMAFTSIGVLTTCLILVGTAYLATENINKMVGVVKEQNEMSVILFDDKDEVLFSIKDKIDSIENVVESSYISKEDGLEDTKEMLGDDSYLLDGMEDRNAIPPKLVVKIDDLAIARQTQDEISSIDGVEMVLASHEFTDTMVDIQKGITGIGSTLIIILAIISLVIISNTIRATIFSRRKEINIMKFVGANNSFIRIPFIVEGFLLGLISAILAFFAISFSYNYIISLLSIDNTIWLDSIFKSIIPFELIALDIGIFFVVVSTVLGSIGSAISIKNHVKV